VMHVGDSRRADLQGAAAVGIRGFLLDRPTVTLDHFVRHVRHFVAN